MAKVFQQRLLEIQGFLNYVVSMYNWMTPYMKGIHNTMDGWQHYRDSGGWKMKGKPLQAMLAERFQMSELCGEAKIALEGPNKGDLGEPPKVLLVERLQIDVEALKKLTAPAAPPRLRLRAQDILLALYLTDDASGTGFGSALIKDKGILYYSWT